MTVTLPPHADVRDCRLYRFRVYHPDDMGLPAEQRRIVIGYIGETVRRPIARLLEHIMDQPWADTIVGWDVDPRVFAGKQAVLAAERWAIENEKPLYNVIHNEGGHRIPPPLAMRQRRARDAARQDVPRWVHPADRGGAAPAVSAPRARSVARRRWRPWQKHLLAYGIAVAACTLAGWGALAHWARFTGAPIWMIPVGWAGLLLWGWLGFPWWGKRWRSRCRRALKRLK